MESKTLSQFQVRYAETVGKIYNFVYYRTGRDHALAEDLTSEIFMKALERYETYHESGGSFSSWVFTIARNHVIDRYRTHREQVSIDALANVLPAPARDLSQEIDDRSTIKRVLAAIDTLPPQHREILVLKFMSELETDEIAHVLGKKPGAIRVALHRALQALKRTLT